MSPGEVVRIADAHHHLWDLTLNRYPWLEDQSADPTDPLGVGMLQRNYVVDDLRADAAGLPLVHSVHVEAAHDSSDPVRETHWLQGLTDRQGLPSAIVPAVVLEGPDAARILDAHLEHAAVRGVRQMLDRNLKSGASEETTLMGDDTWRQGLALLAPLGLSFDLQVLPSQLTVAAGLAADFDDTIFVLNHGGYHVPASDEQHDLWRAGVEVLARQPNVVAKVSGYDLVDPTWAPAGYDEYVTVLLEAFGIDRVLFGSNFPVDGKTTTYTALVQDTLRATSGLTSDERDRLFYRNTVRIYRIDDALTSSA